MIKTYFYLTLSPNTNFIFKRERGQYRENCDDEMICTKVIISHSARVEVRILHLLTYSYRFEWSFHTLGSPLFLLRRIIEGGNLNE